MSPGATVDNSDFHIGILCALPLESRAVRGIFDEIDGFDNDSHFTRASTDTGSYTAGKIGPHSVVLGHLPGMGLVDTANFAQRFLSSFAKLQLVLLVGVCGGSPRDDKCHEIRLGDVIIGTRAIKSDLGRLYQDGLQSRGGKEDTLGRQSPEIRGFINKLESYKHPLRETTARYLSQLLAKPEFQMSLYPGSDKDKLFNHNYLHKHYDSKVCQCKHPSKSCDAARETLCNQLGCDSQHLIQRNRLQSQVLNSPALHFGTMASRDAVIKYADYREYMFRKEKAIGFDMESAGLWEYLPTVIVKGVCDYADSHKNNLWQDYAAASAAACTRAVLDLWDRSPEQSIASQATHPTTQFNNSMNTNVVNQSQIANLSNFTLNF
ncbi:purine and uridine phosphorylase [Aspergillus taichungensis]|uniref:Purine and uridine phosphorylase n=1 Tax=Aspergillus taichungensis TaxID=482145 RepID=A0A2J5HVA0_9EURO|nr:purine and uridine phosphorylase [Aspergillus taichungensis]